MIQVNLNYYKDASVNAFVRKVDGGYIATIQGVEYTRSTKADILAVVNTEITNRITEINTANIQTEIDAAVADFNTQLNDLV